MSYWGDLNSDIKREYYRICDALQKVREDTGYTGELENMGKYLIAKDNIMNMPKEELISLFWKIHAKYEDELNVPLRELFEEGGL